MFQTNVIGLFHLTQILVRDFKKRNTGVSAWRGYSDF
jgi:NADP-dependent 3-hydroxy acid dehydrogenase YdfG